jgi:hypothetical protein
VSALSFRAPHPPRDDRRECPRLPLSRILATFEGSAGAHSAIGHGDVSTGGALWVGPASQATSDVLELTFHLEDAPEPLHLRAQVVGREEAGAQVALHLRFVEPSFDAERRIARHVDGCLRHLSRSA